MVGFGLLCNFVGFFGMWAAATSRIPARHGVVVLLNNIANFGGTWTDLGCMGTNIRNFPSERGTVIGERWDCLTWGWLQPSGAEQLVMRHAADSNVHLQMC